MKRALVSMLAGLALCTAHAQPADSLLQKGINLSTEGRFREAINLLLSAGADTGSAASRFQLGLCYANINEYSQARRFLKEAIALDSNNVNYRFQYARTLTQFGSLQEAESEYWSIIQRDSLFYRALFQLGALLHDQKNYKRSLTLFSRIISAYPDDFLSQFYVGSSLVGLGKQDSAESFLRKSMDLNPTFVPAIVTLGSIRLLKKDYLEVLKLYEMASALRPANAEYVYRIGQAYRDFNDHERAVMYFKKAVDLDSTNALYFAQLGFVYYQLKMYQHSVDANKKAISLDNENPRYFINLALSYLRMDSTNLAIKAYEGAIRATNPDEVAKLYVSLGSLLSDKKRYREALKAYQRAADIDPLNRDAVFSIGWVYDMLEDIPSATKGYERYLRMTSGDSVSTSRKRVIETRLNQWKK